MELERRFKRLEDQVTALSSKLVATEKWQRAIEPWLFNTFQLDIRELINIIPESELVPVETAPAEFSDNLYFASRRADPEQRKRKGSEWTEVERYPVEGHPRQDLIELRAEDICIPTFSAPDFEQANGRLSSDTSPKKGRRNTGTLDLTCPTATPISTSPTKIATASASHVMSFFCSPFPFSVGSEAVSVVEIPNLNQFRRIGFKDAADAESNVVKQEQSAPESLKLERKDNQQGQGKQESSEFSDAVAEPFYYNDDEAEDYIEEIVESASASESAVEEVVPLQQGPPKINLKDWEMKCIICLKHFASSIRLVSHEGRVHEIKKGHAIKCMFQPNCRLIFRGVRQLSVHMKARHKDDYERLLKQNINPMPEVNFNLDDLVTPVSASTLELLREADSESLGKRVPLPKDWNTTNHFSDRWLQLMERHQNGIMPYNMISKRDDLKLWFEYLPNEKEPEKSRYRCRLCYNYAHYLQLPVNSVYLLAKAEGQLRENDCLNQRCINHHNRNSLTHKSIIRLLKELCEGEGDGE